jgi:UDP-N-acetyl-alpha-D-muramoyl-L-alanyl-L-glutamate epimerase
MGEARRRSTLVPVIPPHEAESFELTRGSLEDRTVTLGYALHGRGGERIDFEERLHIPESLGPLGSGQDEAVTRALSALHVVGGTSYWKTAVPRRIRVGSAAQTPEDASFWTDVYTKGLGEFFYRNGIDPTGAVALEGSRQRAAPPAVVQAEGPALVLWGGGKDSVVSERVLAQSGEPHELLTIGRGGWEWIGRSASLTGVPHHVVERRLDPRLFQLNEAGALNGHVPVSAYLAAAGVLVALLTGRRAVIASNESSASEGNTSWHGLDVNHQWSKSLEFERGFSAWLARHLPGSPRYFSLLRPLTELRIVKAFTSHPRFFTSVTSCNRNFSQSGPAAARWCLTCPKCVFVALMARPWLDDAVYHSLFGGDPLADPANCDLVEELLGVRGVKPFECVGTPDETAAALHLAKTRGVFVPHGCMTIFNDRVAALRPDLDEVAARALARSDEHAIPAPWLAKLDAYLDRH